MSDEKVFIAKFSFFYKFTQNSKVHSATALIWRKLWEDWFEMWVTPKTNRPSLCLANIKTF